MDSEDLAKAVAAKVTKKENDDALAGSKDPPDREIYADSVLAAIKSGDAEDFAESLRDFIKSCG